MDTDEEEFNDKLIPYKIYSVWYKRDYISFDCYNKGCNGHNISTEYNENTEKRRINDFLDQVSKSNPNLSNIRIESAINPDLIRAILQHFLQQRRQQEEDDHGYNSSNDDNIGEDENNGAVKTFTLRNCEISTFTDLNYINTTNVSNRTIRLNDCFIFNYNVNSNKRDEIHKAIGKCTYFTTWEILECNNKDLIFLLNALVENRAIADLRINFCEYRQLQEVMIFNSITNLVSNNKHLSSLTLDFDYIPFNFSSANAIIGLANALINSKTITALSFENLCLRDTERKMLRLLLKHGTFNEFDFKTRLLSLYAYENNQRIEVSRRSYDEHPEYQYNGYIENTYEQQFNLLLNDISTSCFDLKEVEICTNCQFQKVMIFNAITNFVSNNKYLSSFKLGLDFEYIPINLSTSDAITTLANGLMNSQSMTDVSFNNLCLQDTENKMLRLLLKCGTFRKLEMGPYMIILDTTDVMDNDMSMRDITHENHLRIKVNNNTCHDQQYNYKNAYKEFSNMLLNDISTSCFDLKEVEICLEFCTNCQFQEVMIFNSITNIVSNNKYLSSFKLILDSGYFPINLSSSAAITTFYDMNYTNVIHNSDRTIKLTDCGIFNDSDSNNKRDKIHQAIENCSYFKTWEIKGYTNKDLIFFLSALTRNNSIKRLNITFSEYRQLEEIMIFNSITNLVVNNKNLSSLKLNFDYIPVNFSSADAIIGLTNALTDSKTIADLHIINISLRDTERKMLRLLLKHGTFNRFDFETRSFSLYVSENNQKIEVSRRWYIGNTYRYEQQFNWLLNDLIISCSDSKNIHEISFNRFCLQDMERKKLPLLLKCRQFRKLVIHPYETSLDTTDEMNTNMSMLDMTHDNHLKIKFDNDGWYDQRYNDKNTKISNLLLNEISTSCFNLNKVYIRLKFQKVMIFNSITNILSNNKYLSSLKLDLDFEYIPINLSTSDAITTLANALMNSQSKTDVSFNNLCLQDTEIKMLRLLLKCGTFQTFKVRSSLLSFEIIDNEKIYFIQPESSSEQDKHNKNTDKTVLNMLLNDISTSCFDLKEVEIRLKFQKVMIFNSITNFVSNNKYLSWLELDLDFEYIPINLSTTDAITTLANALMNSQSRTDVSFNNLCLQDTEIKMLRLLLKCGTFQTFKVRSSLLSFEIVDNEKINFIQLESSREHDKYNKTTDEKILNMLLNDISTSCSDLVEIDITEIVDGELATAILLHFVRHNNSIQFVVIGLGLLSEIFQDHNFIEAVNNDKPNIKLNFGREEGIINSNNRAIIGNTIEKVCFFSSWCIDAYYKNVEDMTFVLNALSRNKYLQSLHIEQHYLDETQFNSCIESITNVVNQSKTLSKLVLHFRHSELSTTATAAFTGLAEALINSDTISDLSLHICHFAEDWVDCITNIVTHTKKLSKLVLDLRDLETTTTAAVSNLAEALIYSETIKDLSLYGFELKSMEAFQIIHSIFERKDNLQRLSLDSSLLSWEEERIVSENERDDEWTYKKRYFKASVFSNLLQNRINSNLRELDLECDIDNTELSQEMLLFLALLKDSNLEKLSFRTDYFSEYASSVCRCLFVDVIPFMSRLQDFKFSTEYGHKCVNLRETFIKSVGICNRTLIKAEWEHGNATSNQMFVKSIGPFLQRNKALADCIENKTHISKSAYPKVFVTTKPTGPDAAFQLLCNLRLLVGPKENTLSVKPKSALSYTITTKTPTCQSNKRKCTML